METSQRETCCRMIEYCSQPRCSRVASLASLWESCLHVVRCLCGLEVRQMAGHARSNSDGVIIVDVAARAGNLGVETG